MTASRLQLMTSMEMVAVRLRLSRLVDMMRQGMLDVFFLGNCSRLG